MSEFLEITVDKFTFKIATGHFYTSEGVWASFRDGALRVGLSDFLQQRSGDIAFAEVRPAGTELKSGDEIAMVESIKVNISLPSPAAGKVVRVNPLMGSAPETINLDPYGEGWVCEIEPVSWEADRKQLMDAETYFAQVKREAENEAK